MSTTNEKLFDKELNSLLKILIDSTDGHEIQRTIRKYRKYYNKKREESEFLEEYISLIEPHINDIVSKNEEIFSKDTRGSIKLLKNVDFKLLWPILEEEQKVIAWNHLRNSYILGTMIVCASNKSSKDKAHLLEEIINSALIEKTIQEAIQDDDELDMDDFWKIFDDDCILIEMGKNIINKVEIPKFTEEELEEYKQSFQKLVQKAPQVKKNAIKYLKKFTEKKPETPQELFTAINEFMLVVLELRIEKIEPVLQQMCENAYEEIKTRELTLERVQEECKKIFEKIMSYVENKVGLNIQMLMPLVERFFGSNDFEEIKKELAETIGQRFEGKSEEEIKMIMEHLNAQ